MPVDSGPLTRAQVVAALSAASEQHPANFTGRDLPNLDLSGLDLTKANLAHVGAVVFDSVGHPKP